MSDVVHTAKTGWILSGGRDKYFHYHCVNTGLTLSVVVCYFFVLFLLFFVVFGGRVCTGLSSPR